MHERQKIGRILKKIIVLYIYIQAQYFLSRVNLLPSYKLISTLKKRKKIS
jgi:hypothetical protein